MAQSQLPRLCDCPCSGNSRMPAPTTTGMISGLSSSMTSRSSSQRSLAPLPWTWNSRPGVALSLRTATSRSPLLRRSRSTFRDWADAPGVRYVPVDGELELLPGVRLVPAPGHARGTQVVVFGSGKHPAVNRRRRGGLVRRARSAADRGPVAGARARPRAGLARARARALAARALQGAGRRQVAFLVPVPTMVTPLTAG